MDEYNINKIIKSINSALDLYPGVEFKLDLKTNDIRGFSINISGFEKDKLTFIEKDNLRMSREIGFNVNIIGLEFVSIYSRSKDTFKILEILPNRRKNCILAKSMRTDKQFVFPPSVVKDYFGSNKLINRTVNLEKLLKINDE